MKIAVILDGNILSGGGFHQAVSTMLLLNKYRGSDYNFVFFTTYKENINFLKEIKIKVKFLKLSYWNHITYYITSNNLARNVLNKLRIVICNQLENILKKEGIDIIYFLSPCMLSLWTDTYNYIITVWDLCHRDYIEFPEVKHFREFEKREYLYEQSLPKATSIITDSEIGKNNIVRRYNIDEDRIKVLPFLSSTLLRASVEDYNLHHIDIKKKYAIDGDYIYYPAQFWAHKNHIYILEGLKILKEGYGIRLNAIFSGADKGNLHHILKKACEFKIDNQIHYAGFVDTKEIPYLYKQAIALVMPTYFGPTNLPPLEAFMFECPVLYSNLPGLKEQVKDAALLMDLKNPNSFVENILKIIRHDKEIHEMIQNGKKILEAWNETLLWDELKKIFDEYSILLKCWK